MTVRYLDGKGSPTPGPYINDETPPGIKFHATPRNAVTGTLRSDAAVQDVADALTEAVESLGAPRSLLVFSTRRRTGIEPARELVALSSVLKTAGPTRNPDASGSEDSGAGSEARGVRSLT